MSTPIRPNNNTPGMQWVLRSRQVTPPEAFAIAAEFRRAADEVYACQQRYRDVILPGIEQYWTGLAGERFLQISQPIAADLRQLAAELEQRAGEIENIKIDQYWWEEVPDPAYHFCHPVG
jgi:hypothetical protein